MKFIISTLFFALFSMISAQRGSYAGNSPIVSGLRQPFNNEVGTRNNNGNSIQQVPQFMNPNNNNLINRVNQLPASNQPFWFLNQQAINAHLSNPQPQFDQGYGFNGPAQNFQPGTFIAGR